ncbi:MAG: ribosomal protein S18-alanine N-acetyltransferase [Candidatus Phytoplasma sp.]|nr:ribosomal protein S18-alanine N-acetyltransferase [Phytoplasma sp.]
MIKKITIENLEDIVNLEKKHLNQTLGYDFLNQELTTNPYTYMIGYEKEKKLIGYLSARIFEENAEILNIVVEKEFQKQGIGTKLLQTLINEVEKRKIKSIILEVRASNHNAQKLYQALGFEKILTKPDYYPNEDAYIYLWKKD